MTKKQKKELCRYVRWVANEMGLRDWHFNVIVTNDIPQGGMEYADKETFSGIGSMTPTPGQVHGTIRFRPDFIHYSREHQREIVVHELVHCHLTDMREFLRTGIHGHLVQSTYDALMFGFDLAWEHAVDGIARPWAEKMPMIDWPKKGK